MLAPVGIDAIDHTLDGVLAQAAAVMATRRKARAGIGREVSEHIERCRPAQLGESPPTEPVGQVALRRAPGERETRR